MIKNVEGDGVRKKNFKLVMFDETGDDLEFIVLNKDDYSNMSSDIFNRLIRKWVARNKEDGEFFISMKEALHERMRK